MAVNRGMTSCATSLVQTIGCAATSRRSRRVWAGKDSADGKAFLALVLMWSLLLLDVLADDGYWGTSARRGEVGRRP